MDREFSNFLNTKGKPASSSVLTAEMVQKVRDHLMKEQLENPPHKYLVGRKEWLLLKEFEESCDGPPHGELPHISYVNTHVYPCSSLSVIVDVTATAKILNVPEDLLMEMFLELFDKTEKLRADIVTKEGPGAK